VATNALCRSCGAIGDHWTDKCPFQEKSTEKAPPTRAEREAARLEEKDKDTYVPPSMRRGATMGSGDDSKMRRDDAATIRVTNLSEDTKEQDLQDLFRNYGPISRIFLAKDKSTQLSKGYAFITFLRREDAQRAMERLSGVGYDHLILHIEWAK
jgi:translation initiation factor 3 subunit G